MSCLPELILATGEAGSIFADVSHPSLIDRAGLLPGRDPLAASQLPPLPKGMESFRKVPRDPRFFQIGRAKQQEVEKRSRRGGEMDPEPGRNRQRESHGRCNRRAREMEDLSQGLKLPRAGEEGDKESEQL